MSRRTPIEELVDEESGADTPSRRRSSRIAAVVTRRTSVSDDIPAPITKAKRLSQSQEASLGSDDPKGVKTPQKNRYTRSASKSPSALSKTEAAKVVPATRSRRIASASSIMDEESNKEERAASPALSKVTTRRRSLRAQSTSPTSESTGNSKVSTPRKSTRAVSASPTNDLTKSAPPKLKGRRPSVTEKIIPLEAIEETKTEEVSTTKDETQEKSPNSEEKTQDISDENLPFKKKKSSTLKAQNLESIVEKITEETETDSIDQPKGQEKDVEIIIGDKGESSVCDESIKKLSPVKSVDSDVVSETVGTEEKKTSSETVESESKPRTPKYSLSLKTKNSPGESVEEKELKAVLNVEEAKREAANTPRRSPRLSTSDSAHNDKTKVTSSNVVNITGESDESFHLKLNLSQFDSSQDNDQQQKNEENGLNISSSSDTSDKENQAKPSEMITKKLVVLADKLNVDKITTSIFATPEPSKNQQKSQGRKSSFYEPMEVDEFPSDYEYSILEKEDANDKTPSTKQTSDESPISPIIPSKVLNRSHANASPKITEISEKAKLLEASSVEQGPKTLEVTTVTSSPSIEIKFSEDHSISTELEKSVSPKRRSARLLNQSKSDSPEENEKNVANSTPKQKPARSIGEDLENSMEIGLNETTVSVVEDDLEDVQSPLGLNNSNTKDLVTVEDVNKSKQEDTSMTSNLNKSAIRNEDQKKLVNDKNDSKNAATLSVIEIDDEEIDEKEADNKDEDPKFSKESDSDGTTKNQSTANNSLRRKSSGKDDSFVREGKSNDDEKQPDHKDTNTKNLSKRESFSKNKSKTEEESEEQTTSNKDEGEISISSDSDDEDIDKLGHKDTNTKDLSNRESFSKNKSKAEEELKEQTTSNKDAREISISLDSDDEDIDKLGHKDTNTKDLSNRKESSLKNKSRSEEESAEDINKSNSKDLPKRKSSSKNKSKTEEDSDDENIKSKDNENSPVKRISLNRDSSKQQRKSLGKNIGGSDAVENDEFQRNSLKRESKNSNTEQRKSFSNKKDEELKLFEAESEDSIKNTSVKRISISTKLDEESKFSEDSSDENTSKNGSGKKITSNEITEEKNCLEDSDDDIRAPFLLYTIKSKKSSKPTKPATPKDKRKSLNIPKGNESPHFPSILIDSDSNTEKQNVSDLDTKIESLIANQHDEDSSSNSSCQSVTDYLDDMAEEGEEDTPSEGSNDIIDQGESIGSTESEIDSDDTYQNDSFIDDSADDNLLSGEEYDLGQEKKLKRPKKKLTRVITVSDSEEENNLELVNDVDITQPKVTESREKVVNGIEEDSDLEKMSTQPYCGLTPPSIISLRESLSDNDKMGSKEETTARVVINKQDNLQSLEELKQHDVLTAALKTSVEKRKSILPLTPKAAKVAQTIFTPNNSILEDQSAELNNSSRKRQSSITIHENIKLEDVAEGSVSDRISKVVDVFCSSVKKDGKERCGNISLNISLEYLKSPPRSEENIEPEEEPLGKVDEKILKKRRSSEFHVEQIKLSAKKEKATNRKSLLQEFLVTDDATNQKSEEGWETLPEDTSKNENLVSKKKSKKGHKNKIILKGVKPKTEKEEIIASDSDMSEDLDAELDKKYSPNASEESVEEELEIVPNTSNKKSKKKKPEKIQVVDISNTVCELLKKDKKRKRDKTNLLEETQAIKPILESKKQKRKSPTLPKILKKPSTSNESDFTSDEVLLEERQQKDKKKKRNGLAEEIKEVVAAETTRTKKKKLKPDQTGPSSSKSSNQDESKFQYFPSRILNTLTNKTEKVPGPSKPLKKPKLVPSSTMGKRAWEADVVDETVLPSTTSSKRFKMDLEGFNKKDYKNAMLFDPSRVKRMESKNLLKKRQKMKF